MFPHQINTGSHSLVKQPSRRQPYTHLTEIERNAREMLTVKLMEPTWSPWSSDVLLVSKKRYNEFLRRLPKIKRPQARTHNHCHE